MCKPEQAPAIPGPGPAPAAEHMFCLHMLCHFLRAELLSLLSRRVKPLAHPHA